MERDASPPADAPPDASIAVEPEPDAGPLYQIPDAAPEQRVIVLPDLPLGRAWRVRSWLVYYDRWDGTTLADLRGYDLVVLEPNNGPPLAEQPAVVARLRAGLDAVLGTDDDVLVFGYISLGEDIRTYGGAPAMVGDGRGPAYFDPDTETLVYQNRGIASYYLDERKSAEPGDWGQDGQPDRHGTWGACYVDAGDPAWQDFILGSGGRSGKPYAAATILGELGFDGLFLDTPEVADPWTGYGYTAAGVKRLIARLDEQHPDKLLLLNRGLFFFVPHYAYQYQHSPRAHIDLLLVESHYLDSNYHLDDATVPDGYNLSPFHQLLEAFVDPKIQVEASRPDNPFPVLSLDYAAYPDSFAEEHAEVFGQALWTSAVRYGRVELITDRRITQTPRLMREMHLPEDDDPPRWDDSSVGYTGLYSRHRFYMAGGPEDRRTRAPRVGIQRAIAGAGEVTVCWDVAHDQTRPVRYNIYWSKSSPIDFATAHGVANVRPLPGAGYLGERGVSGDGVCPYQATLSGLEPGTTYHFAVRAEDSSKPATGPTGPNGGLEDRNTVELSATPR